MVWGVVRVWFGGLLGCGLEGLVVVWLEESLLLDAVCDLMVIVQ